MADDLVAMGGGAWAREDCEAALEGSGGNMEVAMDLLMGGFTKAGAAAQGSAAGGSGGGAGGGAPAAGDGVFTAEDLGNGLWKIVEADRHGQYPFTYAIMAGAAPTRCVLIDTGCGTSDYKAFLDVSLHDSCRPHSSQDDSDTVADRPTSTSPACRTTSSARTCTLITSAVRRTIVAGIWVAFFSRCQQ